jgi:hypothetical protein
MKERRISGGHGRSSAPRRGGKNRDVSMLFSLPSPHLIRDWSAAGLQRPGFRPRERQRAAIPGTRSTVMRVMKRLGIAGK